MASILLTFLLGIVAVQALPALLERGSSPLAELTTTQIDALNPYANYAKAVYCKSAIIPWACGAACAANAAFQPVAAGGDGDSVQFWYVGYDPNLHTIIAAHQGTNKSNLMPLLTDVDALRGPLDSSLFPSFPSSILVHKGFKDEHAKTAKNILANVSLAMSKYNVNSVTLVGHSLGAAISLLDSVYLPLHLPKSTTFKTIVFGLPRVGNQEFANYIDANAHLAHINNQKDPVPTVPGMKLGYVHPAGEVHINANEKWIDCPGQDNPSSECIVGTVHNLFESTFANHDGPYNGVIMRCHT